MCLQSADKKVISMGRSHRYIRSKESQYNIINLQANRNIPSLNRIGVRGGITFSFRCTDRVKGYDYDELEKEIAIHVDDE